MITEQNKEKLKMEKLSSSIQLCEEAIIKAEKYERLKENKDWLSYLADLQILVEQHEKEIRNGSQLLINAPRTGHTKINDAGSQVYVSSKDDWLDFIMRHEIQKGHLINLLKEPGYILEMAQIAREKLPVLKKNLEDLSAGGNGAS